MGKPKKRFWQNIKDSAKASPKLFALYVILRTLVVVIMIAQILNRDYNNVFMCVLTLVLFTLPTFVEHRIKIDIPNTLEVIILLFIFAAEILGEIREFYLSVPGWDTMLHTINGFLCAAIGVAMIDILNKHDRFSIKLSPMFVALLAFCFSMTIGVLWEFFEYYSDVLFHSDMQKDTIITSIYTVTLHPDGKNIPVAINGISDVIINHTQNGVQTTTQLQGYLDIGLIDTMKDLTVNFIGAFVFSIIGYFYTKNSGSGKNGHFVRRFILTRITDEIPDKESGTLPPSGTDTEASDETNSSS